MATRPKRTNRHRALFLGRVRRADGRPDDLWSTSEDERVIDAISEAVDAMMDRCEETAACLVWDDADYDKAGRWVMNEASTPGALPLVSGLLHM